MTSNGRSTSHGLTGPDAAQRLAQHGPNEIRREARTPPWRILARQFASPMIGLLAVAAGVAFALGETVDAVAILVIVAMNLFGLLPVLFSQGVGSDMARRMAGPMFGGLVTLTFMTALVLPAMWVLWRTRQLRKGTLAASLAVSKAEEG